MKMVQIIDKGLELSIKFFEPGETVKQNLHPVQVVGMKEDHAGKLTGDVILTDGKVSWLAWSNHCDLISA